MKIVIAPDSYKECLSSSEVAAAMAEGMPQDIAMDTETAKQNIRSAVIQTGLGNFSEF
ncbi:MAG: glycerate kinase [Bacteroidales bacterium]|jgi:glycerate kinase|nr:glycerate kinase [Bacteroidales bacterium]